MMTQNTPFSRITIEPATNGYVVEIETPETDLKYVYTSLRITIRELKKLMEGFNDA